VVGQIRIETKNQCDALGWECDDALHCAVATRAKGKGEVRRYLCFCACVCGVRGHWLGGFPASAAVRCAVVGGFWRVVEGP
jgi:hypothetical protein